MKRSKLFVAASLSLAWLAACDAPSKQTAPDTTVSSARASSSENKQGDENAQGKDDQGEDKIHGTRDAFASAGPAVINGAVSWHGGPVLSSIKLQAIYWSSGTIYTNGPTPGTSGAGCVDNSNVGYFMRNISGSPYYNINTTYKAAGATSPLNSVSYTSCWANNSILVPANGASVSDATMRSMIQQGIAAGKLTYDASTLYVIFSAGTTNLGGGFGTQYCAYHTYGNITVGGLTKRVLFSAMPYDYAKPSACTTGSKPANGDAGADNEVSVLIHEIEETHTDPNLNAWYDAGGNENADKCAWTFGTTFATPAGGVANITLGTKYFLVQQNWKAPNSGCALKYP